jgi:hypothetical protein
MRPNPRPCQMSVCDLFSISNWGLALLYPSISSLSPSTLRYMPHVCGQEIARQTDPCIPTLPISKASFLTLFILSACDRQDSWEISMFLNEPDSLSQLGNQWRRNRPPKPSRTLVHVSHTNSSEFVLFPRFLKDQEHGIRSLALVRCPVG